MASDQIQPGQPPIPNPQTPPTPQQPAPSPSTTPPPPTDPPSNKITKLRPLITVILVLIALVLLTAITLYVYFQFNKPQEIATNPTPESTTTQPTPTPEAMMQEDDMSDWQTFTSSQIPVTFKYPPFYIAKDVDELGENDKRVLFLAGSGDVEIPSFTVHMSPGNLPELPYDQKPTGTYNLGGANGIYAELPNGYGDGGEFVPSPFVAIYAQKDGNLFQIKFSGESDINNKTVFQILSTFEFINTTPNEATNHQPYTIDLFGISLNLPSGWKIKEVNRRQEPNQTVRIYDHDCADYEITDDQTLGRLMLLPSCKFFDGAGGNPLPPNSQVIKTLNDSDIVFRFPNEENPNTYEYSQGFIVNGEHQYSDAFLFIKTDGLGGGSGGVFVNAKLAPVSGSSLPGNLIQEFDQLILSLKLINN